MATAFCCPHCEAKHHYPNARAYVTVRCGTCGVTFQITPAMMSGTGEDSGTPAAENPLPATRHDPLQSPPSPPSPRKSARLAVPESDDRPNSRHSPRTNRPSKSHSADLELHLDRDDDDSDADSDFRGRPRHSVGISPWLVGGITLAIVIAIGGGLLLWLADDNPKNSTNPRPSIAMTPLLPDDELIEPVEPRFGDPVAPQKRQNEPKLREPQPAPKAQQPDGPGFPNFPRLPDFPRGPFGPLGPDFPGLFGPRFGPFGNVPRFQDDPNWANLPREASVSRSSASVDWPLPLSVPTPPAEGAGPLEEPKSIALPATADRIAWARGGQSLLMFNRSSSKIHEIDILTGDIRRSLTVPKSVQAIAGNRNLLIVYDQAAHALVKIPLDGPAVEFASAARLPLSAELTRIDLALGQYRAAPLLVKSQLGPMVLVDLDRMQLLPIPSEFRNLSPHRPHSLVASTDGATFVWLTAPESHPTVLRIEAKQLFRAVRNAPTTFVLPSDDGRTIFTTRGPMTNDLYPVDAKQNPYPSRSIMLPAIEGNLPVAVMATGPQSASLFFPKHGPIAEHTLADVPVRWQTETPSAEQFPATRSLVWLPQIHRVVALAPDNRTLRIFPTDGPSS
ncbi:hypothetical protein [Tuwongella immobilis]|uniref:Uncharacterized protein n=1 Tax=Tuwongella immobilis TaxID=692036 RepID=A0A6C2YIK3_9BACT|nr:hypothetical protein [Tuwongella immobilis]VIP01247.1 hypothetical protein : [Tuwongella immobilis]VTR97920.1 hypothetical protein : [Tuwongella immobilis]